MSLSKKWGIPLIIIGIIFIVVDAPQLFFSIFSFSKTLSSDANMNTYHTSYFIGVVTAQLLFLIIGIWLIIKGRHLQKTVDASFSKIK